MRAIVDAAVGFGRIICTLDAAQAAERDATMLAARAEMADVDAAPGGIPLPALTGPLVTSGGGKPSPQPMVAGLRLDDLVGHTWLVVVADAAVCEVEALQWWAAAGATILSAKQHPSLLSLLDDGPGATIVRPDRYVFGCGDLGALTAIAQESGVVRRD